MSTVHVINCIEVPKGYEKIAIATRNHYLEYFKTFDGYVDSIFYKATETQSKINFINIVIWENRDACDKVINSGYDNAEGLNDDGMKVRGKGFPPPIKVHPGIFEIIG